MTNTSIYQDIAQRTGGDIYIGVVGPVRTGKSTFIKKFMEALVLPNMDNAFKKDRALDELPQSAAGRTIMTTEPKFIPNEAVRVELQDNVGFNVRLIDCVGYIVPDALGYIENEQPRMVRTPWYEQEIPFNMAAEIGTQKVIREHSTIGLVLTTDGSIGEIPRSSYLEAEERVISELQEIEKPFVVLLNTVSPQAQETIALAQEMEQKYNVPVLPVDCLSINEGTIKKIMESVLFEFPMKEIGIRMPGWVGFLEDGHPLRQAVVSDIADAARNLRRIREIDTLLAHMQENQYITAAQIESIELGSGSIRLCAELPQELFYHLLSETTGIKVENEGDLIAVVSKLAKIQKEYDRIDYALQEASAKGYGIVTPAMEDLSLEEPEIVKQGGRFGVKLKASAPSYHIIKANIQTEVSPIVGSEKQSEDLVKYMLTEFEEDPLKIWESNIFGKSLHELVNEGLLTKLNRMPEDAREKFQETLQKIINEGSGGLICIIL